MAGRRFKQGYYTLVNPEKYIGDPTKVRYMSSWELECFRVLDNNPNVIHWSSEEIAIPYIKPTDGKLHKYYPDLFICCRTKSGEKKWTLIEIKPLAQTKPPSSRSKHLLYEQITHAVNLSKWKAAQAWCERQSVLMREQITFQIVTERQLFK